MMTCAFWSTAGFAGCGAGVALAAAAVVLVPAAAALPAAGEGDPAWAIAGVFASFLHPGILNAKKSPSSANRISIKMVTALVVTRENTSAFWQLGARSETLIRASRALRPPLKKDGEPATTEYLCACSN